MWKNSDAVIDWFMDLENKNSYSFIQFDICEFYPNITENLLTKALNYAKNYENITS